MVLARLYGLDHDVKTEYVPDVLTDEDCYPMTTSHG